MIDPKDVTIIIPHLGGTPESEYSLGQCFESLQDWKGDLIVVKNGPSCAHLSLSMVINQQGQCKAVNAAAATVNTPWIFVTNDDMVYPLGWWEKLTEGIQSANYCVSPKLVEPRRGAPTFIEYFCGGAGGDFDKQKFLDFVKNYPEQNVHYKNGFNLPFLIKKELWDLVGGYDINYDPWGSNSDSDLEYKIKLAGKEMHQAQNCLVYHFSQTSGTFEPRNNEYYQRNFVYFKEKWGFDRTDEGIWEANFKIPETPIRKFTPDWEHTYGD